MSTQQPLVGILMGSDSDWPIMRKCAETLKSFDIAYEANVLSAHRTPDQALDYAATAQAREQLFQVRKRNLLPGGDFGQGDGAIAFRQRGLTAREVGHGHHRITSLGRKAHTAP